MCFLSNRFSRRDTNSVNSSISSSIYDLLSELVSCPRFFDTLLTILDEGIGDSVCGIDQPVGEIDDSVGGMVPGYRKYCHLLNPGASFPLHFQLEKY